MKPKRIAKTDPVKNDLIALLQKSQWVIRNISIWVQFPTVLIIFPNGLVIETKIKIPPTQYKNQNRFWLEQSRPASIVTGIALYNEDEEKMNKIITQISPEQAVQALNDMLCKNV